MTGTLFMHERDKASARVNAGNPDDPFAILALGGIELMLSRSQCQMISAALTAAWAEFDGKEKA